MAFSVLRFRARPFIGLVERCNCFSVLGSPALMVSFPQIKTEEKKVTILKAVPLYIRTHDYSKKVSQKVQKGYSSASESDTDEEHEKRPRAESKFWRRKMRTIHSLLDVNKDGVISYDDFKLLADKFVNLGHLTEQQAKEFQQCIKELWEAQWGEITPYNLITVEQYLEDMHHVLNDKQLKKKVHKFLPYLFKAVDKDKSGEITVEEFRLFFECLGIDEVHAVASFALIDTNNDGKINMKEFIKLGRDYFLTENETKISKLFWGPLIEH